MDKEAPSIGMQFVKFESRNHSNYYEDVILPNVTCLSIGISINFDDGKLS